MKEKIALFWGSDTGMTEGIAEETTNLLSGDFDVECIDMHNVSIDDFKKHSLMVFGLSTWYDGELQSDWDNFFETFQTIDFTGKTVAIFGLGDQFGYAEYFVDGIGILGEQVLKAGGKLIGKWPAEGYDHDISKAELEPGWFCGLALDEDNQAELTTGRLEKWCEQISGEFEDMIGYFIGRGQEVKIR